MSAQPFSLLFLLCRLFLLPPIVLNISLVAATGGKWELLLPSIGISAMHMQLLNNDKVVMFDRTDFGRSNISLHGKNCRMDPNFGPLGDCSAHSVEYDVVENSIRPLMVLTNVWCSSGSAMSDGSLIQTGGTGEGERVVRLYKSCNDKTCDWKEIKDGLLRSRWYATNHILPDGRQIIVGGRGQFNFEFYPKVQGGDQMYSLPFLEETNDENIENNLYPFVFLNTDGNLFIFANNRAILFDYNKRVVVKKYPEIPGGEPRSYPSTGSAVFLPLKMQGIDKVLSVEVLVCGGAPNGAFIKALNGEFVGALDTCARIDINDPNPKWVMEVMPMARVMGDMVLLPNGNVLIINGGASGAAGWELGRDPVLCPVIYKPDNPIGSRFELQNPSKIPRMYHSTAMLLRDGRVLVGGSNPHNYYNFTNVLYPTELSLEAFSPSYLEIESANLRPKITSPVSQTRIMYGQKIEIQFTVKGKLVPNCVKVTMVAPPFNTHSFSMNQKILVLAHEKVIDVGQLTFTTRVIVPSSCNLTPSQYYLLFVVHQEVPSQGIWVEL
ncbi:hypothetical protein LIER_41119 [Lithospermum erythrorhizon]|uniref:Aldehyde oxidase GLOX n=1 Tax=Lithospermum erythrorhizon TaxID=34254 RepID=A0AAV3R7Q4_LITER